MNWLVANKCVEMFNFGLRIQMLQPLLLFFPESELLLVPLDPPKCVMLWNFGDDSTWVENWSVLKLFYCSSVRQFYWCPVLHYSNDGYGRSKECIESHNTVCCVDVLFVCCVESTWNWSAACVSFNYTWLRCQPIVQQRERVHASVTDFYR